MLIKIASAIGLLHLVAGLTIRGPNDGSPVPAITMTVTTTLTVTATATSCIPLPSVTPPTGNSPATNLNAPGPAGQTTPAIALEPGTTLVSTPVVTPTTTSVLVPAQNTPPPVPTTPAATMPVTTPASSSTSVTGPSSTAALPLIYIYPDTGISIANIRPFFPSNNSFGTTTSFAKSADPAGPSYITTLGTANAPTNVVNVWPFVWTVSYPAGSDGTASTRVCTVNMRDRNAKSKVDVKLHFTPEDVIISPQGEILVDCSAPQAVPAVTATVTATSSNSAAASPTTKIYPVIYIMPERGVTVGNIRPFYPSTNTFGSVTSFSGPADDTAPKYITVLGFGPGPDGQANEGPIDLQVTFAGGDLKTGGYIRLTNLVAGRQQKADVSLMFKPDRSVLYNPSNEFTSTLRNSAFPAV